MSNQITHIPCSIAFTAEFSQDTLSFAVEDFAERLNINTVSVYAAAKEAVAGFDTLPAEAAKTFIYTGNKLNLEVQPALLDLGVGKAATAYLIASWAKTHTEKGYRCVQPIIPSSPGSGLNQEAHCVMEG